MPEHSLPFEESVEFAGGYNSDNLESEIYASEISRALDRIDGGSHDFGSGEVPAVIVVFKDTLTDDDETLLYGDSVPAAVGSVIAGHDPVPATDPDNPTNPDNVPYTQPQPQPIGYEMCDRDFMLTTCKTTQVDAVSDKKVDVATNKQVDYAGPELKLQGCYKLVAGDMVLCDDDADAEINAELSIFNYTAIDQADGTTMVPFAIRSGELVFDPAIPGTQRFDHVVYAMAAPGLGQAHFVRSFDGYVAGRPLDGGVEVLSPVAKVLPTTVPGVSNVYRIWLFHPKGQENAHVLWLLTYRPAGTF